MKGLEMKHFILELPVPQKLNLDLTTTGAIANLLKGYEYSCGQKFWEWHKYTFPKFASSVSLHIFVRCYYGILKNNYKHFISVKGFWQLHEVDAKSQYLQCWPFFFKTSAIWPGMLSINFWATSWLMAAHSCLINAWSLSEFVGFCLSIRLLRIDHKLSMWLRSGEFPAMDPKYRWFVPRAT